MNISVNDDTPASLVPIARSRISAPGVARAAAPLLPALCLSFLVLLPLVGCLGAALYGGCRDADLPGSLPRYALFAIPAIALTVLLAFRAARVLRSMGPDFATVDARPGEVRLGGTGGDPRTIGGAAYASIDAHAAPFRILEVVCIRGASGIPVVALDPRVYALGAGELAGRMNEVLDPEGVHAALVVTPHPPHIDREVMQMSVLLAWKLVVGAMMVVGVLALLEATAPSRQWQDSSISYDR